MTKKIGRPKLPKGELKNVFSLRLSAEERKSIETASKLAGQRPTEWARMRLLGGINHL